MAMTAHHAKMHAIPVHSPKVVGLTAERVTRQSRALIEEVFHAPTAICYAATETGVIGATQISGDSYQLFTWDVILELLDDGGRPVSPGETGSVVVTTLANRAMPLIRYAGLADLASFGTQECVYGVYLDNIEGRRIEALTRSNGERVNPYLVDAVLADVQGITQYQAIQHTLHDLEIIFVPDRSLPGTLPDWEPVIRQLGGLLDPQTRFRVTPVEAIPRREGCHKTPLIVTHVCDAGERRTWRHCALTRGVSPGTFFSDQDRRHPLRHGFPAVADASSVRIRSNGRASRPFSLGKAGRRKAGRQQAQYFAEMSEETTPRANH
jgi:phenylacetate-coenzyme A ligase PaaK-like adenylate-forming protein